MNYKDLKAHITALETEMNTQFEDIHQAINYLLGPQGERIVIRGYKPIENNADEQ